MRFSLFLTIIYRSKKSNTFSFAKIALIKIAELVTEGLVSGPRLGILKVAFDYCKNPELPSRGTCLYFSLSLRIWITT